MKIVTPLILLLILSSCSTTPSPAKNRVPSDNGLVISTSENISAKAIDRAQYIFDTLLSNSPEILNNMIKGKFTIEIIGRNQIITEIERYKYLAADVSADGRSYTEMRGLGGRDACSVGEENLLCLKKQKYKSEDIFVHELSHSIMFNMPNSLLLRVKSAYRMAKEEKLYPLDSYMMADEFEYWAEGTQAWFNATIREDVNGGINSRVKVIKHDPRLADLLEEVYGLVQLNKTRNCPY